MSCVFVVLPRSSPAPHPTRSLHSSPSAGPFPAHLSCFHGLRSILHSSSHPRYRKLLFCLFADPLLPSPAGEAPQEDGGPALAWGQPCQVPSPAPVPWCVWILALESRAVPGGLWQQLPELPRVLCVRVTCCPSVLLPPLCVPYLVLSRCGSVPALS